MLADFIMFALVHFIIAAEAGETAKAATTAAAINILILDLALKGGQRFCWLTRYVSSPANVSGRGYFIPTATIGVARSNAPPTGGWVIRVTIAQPQGFGFAGMLPVATSALQDALPRVGASQR